MLRHGFRPLPLPNQFHGSYPQPFIVPHVLTYDVHSTTTAMIARAQLQLISTIFTNDFYYITFLSIIMVRTMIFHKSFDFPSTAKIRTVELFGTRSMQH